MEEQRLHPEPPLLRLRQLMLDDVEIPVMNVHPMTVDRQPGPTVEHTSAPAPDLGNLPRPANRPKIIRIERTAVVDSQIPVTVRPLGPLSPRSTQSNRAHGGQGSQTIGGILEKVGHGHLPAR